MTTPLINTHDGRHHADELLGIHFLKEMLGDVRIERTRDPERIGIADYAVDNGRVYDPAKGRFDHHPGTTGLPPRLDRPVDYASSGLVWKEHGKTFLLKLLSNHNNWMWDAFKGLGQPEQEALLEEVARRLDLELVCPIDRWDNGVRSYDSRVLPIQWVLAYLEFDTALEAVGRMFNHRARTLLAQRLGPHKLRQELLTGEGGKFFLLGDRLVIVSERRVELMAGVRFAESLAQPGFPVELLAVISPVQDAWSAMFKDPVTPGYGAGIDHHRDRRTFFNPLWENLLRLCREIARHED